MAILSGINGWASPESALQVDISAEISALTEKTTLANDDLFLIEDSAASFAKKKVKKSNVAGGSSALVFQPSGSGTGPLVFSSWSTLMTALANLRTAAGGTQPISSFTIEFDDALGTCTVPAGTYDMTGVTWAGRASVTVANGVTLTGLRKFAGPSLTVELAADAAAAPVTDLADGEAVYINGTYIAALGAQPFFSITGTPQVLFEMRSVCTLGDGTNDVIAQPSGASEVILSMHADSNVSANAVTGGASAFLTVSKFANSASYTAQTYSGTVSVTSYTHTIHDNVGSEITALSAPAGGLAAGDVVLVEDVSASDIKAKATITAVHGVAGITSALSEKTTPVAADLIEIEDSASSNAKKKVQVGNLVSASSIGTNTALGWVTRPTAWGAASSYDDEFTSNTSANYTFSPSLSGSAIDPYSTIVTNPRVAWATVNPSCLSFQPADATACWMSRAVTLDTNCALWFRFIYPAPGAQTIDPDSYHAAWIGFSETTTIESSTEHYVAIQIGSNETSATDYAVSSRRRVGAGAAVIGGVTLNNSSALASGAITQGLIQKISGTYYFYAATDALDWRYLGSYAYGGNTLDNICILFQDDDGLPGSSVMHLDFLRYLNGIAVPPV